MYIFVVKGNPARDWAVRKEISGNSFKSWEETFDHWSRMHVCVNCHIGNSTGLHFVQGQPLPLGRGFLISLAGTKSWIYNGEFHFSFVLRSLYFLWSCSSEWKFPMLRSYCHFFSVPTSCPIKKSLNKFLFSSVLDCNRFWQGWVFSSEDDITLLLLILSTIELIPGSYTILSTQRFQSNPIL